MMTSRAGRSSRRSAGFTLLEVVIVVVLVAIVTAIVVPRLAGTFGSTGVTSGARQIASMLKYARGRAVMDRLRYRVELDLDAGEYWLSMEEDPVRNRGVFKPVGGNLGSRRRLPGSAVFGKFRNDARRGGSRGEEGGVLKGDGVVFYPDGRGDRAWLVIQDPDGRAGYTVRIVPSLGRIVLREGIEEDL